MALVWKCKCGFEIEEAGDLKGAGRAGGHLATAKRQGEADEHEVLGLYDTETGDQLVSRLNMRAAGVLFGRETPTKQKADKTAGDKPAKDRSPAASAPSAGRKGVVVVGTLEVSGVVELLWQADLQAHPEVFPPEVFTDEKTRAAEMGRWVEQCLVRFHIDHAQTLGFDRFFMAAIQESAAPAVAAAGGG